MAALVASCCLSLLNHQPVCYDLWGNGPAACSSYLVLSYYRDRGKSTLCSKWVITHPTDIEYHGIHSHLLMANRWGKCGNSVRSHFLGLQNHYSDCSHESKRHLLLGRIPMTNLDSVFKSRDITLPTKVHIVKAMVFPVVMYRCENWTIRKAGC